jgi:hypothetical protein
MFNQPLFSRPCAVMFSCLRAAAIVACVATAAAAEPSKPSIRESGRKEVVRLVAAEAGASMLPPNYPRTFARPVPTSRFGRQIVAGTAGAVGGLFAGALVGGGLTSIGCRGEDCALPGIVIGAPIGAAAGAVIGALLAR